MPNEPAARKTKPKMKPTASAKAEVSAKASYQRKRTHTISETIPEDVTRSKVSAWLDVISPAREWLGLKGDVIRHRREQLLLQQEATLAEIERRAAAIIAPGVTIQAVPATFLVQCMEQASLEDPSSSLVEFWGNLLASAAEHYDGQYLHFSRLVAELSPQEASLFRDGFTGPTLRATELALNNVFSPSCSPDRSRTGYEWCSAAK